MHTNMQSCIDACEECHRVCLETMACCLQQGGQHADARHITLLMDCSQICGVSVDFMVWKSSHHAHTCGICAEICMACAEGCESMCADTCRRCAEECRKMAHEHA